VTKLWIIDLNHEPGHDRAYSSLEASGEGDSKFLFGAIEFVRFPTCAFSR